MAQNFKGVISPLITAFCILFRPVQLLIIPLNLRGSTAVVQSTTATLLFLSIISFAYSLLALQPITIIHSVISF